jgi:hypothetical protein
MTKHLCGPGPITDKTRAAIDAFENFLSWGEQPSRPGHLEPRRTVPPAWWAYTLGATKWCPPAGEL